MRFADGRAVNRLGVFFFYDAQGVVDDYVTVLLDGLTPHFTQTAIVCNGDLTSEGRAKLSKYSDRIIVRENKGFDAWAYKTALDSYGWDALTGFDEIVLFNATIMGPVHPFSEMFDAMDRRDLDFWGITKFHKVPFDPFGRSPFGYLPEHIQSHFHAYRRSLVSSKEFQNYWNNLPPINSYEDSVGLHESLFTKRFADLGYKWDVYVNTNDLENYAYGPITFAAQQLIEEQHCPIFKRRSFFHDYHDVLNQSVGNASLDLYEYLRDHTDYDTDLIWQNLLRTVQLSDLTKNLQLVRVLSQNNAQPTPPRFRVALVLHLYYMDILNQVLRYAQSMPEGCDVIITVGSEEKACIVRERCAGMPYNIDVRIIENRGRDVSALLVGAGKDVLNYDLVCFAHDKKVRQLRPETIGEGFAKKCFENTLASKAYVTNIINLFADNPRLGVAMPIAPNHADYFYSYAFSWGPNYQGTKKLLNELGVKVPLNPHADVVAPLGTMFWFRPKALHGLIDKSWSYSDFPPEPNPADGSFLHFVERAYCYVAQSNGYYSEYVLSERFARLEITNLAFETRELAKAIGTTLARPTLLETCRNTSASQSLHATIARNVKALIKHNPTLTKMALSVRHLLGKDPVVHRHEVDPANRQ